MKLHILLQFLDIITTLYGVKVLGLFEVNPVSRYLLDSPALFIFAKVFVCIYLCMVYNGSKRHNTILVVLNLLYAFVVISNIIHIGVLI